LLGMNLPARFRLGKCCIAFTLRNYAPRRIIKIEFLR
jgi:hypothetical protein